MLITNNNLLVKKDYNQFSGALKTIIVFLLDYPVFTNLGVL